MEKNSCPPENQTEKQIRNCLTYPPAPGGWRILDGHLKEQKKMILFVTVNVLLLIGNGESEQFIALLCI